ncbi:MAG: tetratricopeptide repeat protein [Thermoflexales bacterium]|nr:tetratricopeptide repeat protein [Thermoflexales bacterium]
MNALRVLLLGLVLVALLFTVQANDVVTASFIARADEYQHTYLYRQAEDYVRLALTRQPWNAALTLRLADLKRLQHSYTETLTLLDQATTLGADVFDVTLVRAQVATDQHQYDLAAQHWQSAAVAHPIDPALPQRAIDAYLHAENWPAAQALAEQWTRSGSLQAHLFLGKLLAFDDLARARQEFAVANLEATSDLVRALDQPDQALRLLLLGRAFLAQNDLTLALRAFESAIEANPAYAEAYAYAGFVLDQLGRDGRARLDRAVELDRELAVARYFRARSAWQRGQLDQALIDLQAANELDPKNRVITAELGRLYMQRSELARAEVWLIAARDLQPDDPAGWLALAELYAGRAYGSPAQALEAAQQAVKRAPAEAAAHVWLGAAYLINGDRASAENELRRAVELDATSALAQLYLGRLYGRDTEPGREAYERARALDPAGPIGAQAQRALELP